VHDNGHAHYEDELAAYLLGALTNEEEQEFTAHLAGCEHCQARERWLRASVDVLPSSVEQLEPPPALRERLLETVRAEAPVDEDATRAPSRRRQARGFRSWFGSLPLRPAMAAAAAVLLVAGVLAGYALRDLGGEKTTTVAVKTTPAAPPGARATIVRDGDRGILRVERLPQRSGKVYEIWLVRGGEPRPSTLFQVGRDGAGAAAIPSGLDGATQVMVTLEPARGSVQPTSTPILQARV
jgi:anti-sigma factor RsiW